VVAIPEEARGGAVEPTHEIACGNEDLTSDVPGPVADQIGVCRRHVLGWRGVQGALHADVVEQSASVQFGDVRFVLGTIGQPGLGAGAYDVGADTMPAKFGGNGERQPVYPALARGITRAAVVAEKSERAGVDDRAAALRDHFRRCRPAGLERGEQVRVKQVAKQSARHVEDRLGPQCAGARTVDQDVDAAEFADARIDQRVGDTRIGRRTGEPECGPADALDGLRYGGLVATVDDDVGAKGGKQFRDRQPDTAGAADDDGSAASEPRGQLGSWPNVMASIFQ
jgi:hypothetical protein